MKILTKWKNFKNMRIKQKEQMMMKVITGGGPTVQDQTSHKKPPAPRVESVEVKKENVPQRDNNSP